MNKTLIKLSACTGIVAIVAYIVVQITSGDLSDAFVRNLLYGDGSGVQVTLYAIYAFTIVAAISCISAIVNAVLVAAKLGREKTGTDLNGVLSLVAGAAHLILVLPAVFHATVAFVNLNTLSNSFDLDKLGTISQHLSKLNDGFSGACYGLVGATLALAFVWWLTMDKDLKFSAEVNVDLSGAKEAATKAYEDTVSSIKSHAENESKAATSIEPADIDMELVLQTLQYHLYQVKYLKVILPFIDWIFVFLCILVFANCTCFWGIVLTGVLAFICRKYNMVALGTIIYTISCLMDIKYYTYFGNAPSIFANVSYYLFLVLVVLGLLKYVKTDNFALVKRQFAKSTADVKARMDASKAERELKAKAAEIAKAELAANEEVKAADQEEELKGETSEEADAKEASEETAKDETEGDSKESE